MISKVKRMTNIYSGKDWYFLLGLILWTMTVFLAPDYINPIKKYVGLVVILLFIVKIILSKYAKQEYIVAVGLGLILLISAYFSEREALFVSFFALFASKDIKLKDTFRVIFWTGALSLILSIVIYMFIDGFSQSNLETRQFFGMNLSVSKNSLGYSHANMLYLLMFVLTSIYAFLRFEILKFVDYIAITAVSLIFFIITFSRTGIMVSLISIITLYLLKKIPKEHKFYDFISYIPILLIIFSFVLPAIYTLYPQGVMHLLNRTLSDRLYYAAEFLRVAEASFFGTNVHGLLGGEINFPLRADNSFVLVIRAYGYIIFAVMSMFTLKLSRQKFKREEWYVILMMYLYCFTEGFFVIAVQNISLFIIVRKYFNYSELENKTLLTMLRGKKIEPKN